MRVAQRKALEYRAASVLQGFARGMAVRRKLRLGLLPEPDNLTAGTQQQVQDSAQYYPQAEGAGVEGYGYGYGEAAVAVAEPEDLYSLKGKKKRKGNVSMRWEEPAEPPVPLRDVSVCVCAVSVCVCVLAYECSVFEVGVEDGLV